MEASKRPVVDRAFAVRLVKIVVAAAVLVSVTRVLGGYRDALAGRVEQVRFPALLTGFGLAAVYRVVNALGWVLVLRSLGHPLRAVTGVRLWLVSETLRWLPGSVWSFFSRVTQAKAAGVPASTASLSLPLELMLTIVAWTVAACTGIGLSGAARIWLARLPTTAIAATIVALGLIVGLTFAVTKLVPAAGISKKLGGFQASVRELSQLRPRLSLLLATTTFFAVLCFLNGAAFLAVLSAVCDAPPGFLATAGINAAGWLLGFFAFFAPAGLGVREGGMAVMLAPLISPDAAVVGVLLWRLVQIAVELACLVLCFAPEVVAAARRLVARTWVEIR
jgi:uncharacterized membrane protein YbhN (UPF0104 family)